jgi:hypothetical protein
MISKTPNERALRAFNALRADLEQFDDHPSPGDGQMFSDRVPLYMKSYLVNWLRDFVRHHGDTVQSALADEPSTNQ